MLKLPNDGPASGRLLDEALSANGPAAIVLAIAKSLPPLAARLAAGSLHGDPAELVGVNDSGDRQKALDLAAHHYMIEVLRVAGVRQVLSEEAERVVVLNADGLFDVAMDPIDGSGSIGIGAPLGTLFSILPADAEGFLRPGRAVVAAGYASFGHSLDFGYSLGQGVHIATLDPETGLYRLIRENVVLKPVTSTIAYNASNEHYWSDGLRAWARDLRMGADGPRERDFNMRWLAAAVGDLHRILMRGGAFLYPQDRRRGYENGRLRLIYECTPMAFLIEQAGGAASDGTQRILDRQPADPHEFAPLIFGARDEVETILSYLAANQG
ncbi:class 1 fructose-bisphosphatase [Paracoccus salsus]|uniref:class 1 fructose-bisphosphatase n=1 Tax=Paracoccus salsus TaxID=2911061 RepID=UPI001F00640D|nr:class 1 fructose-bisphosphatase [Paracoccus salsus]MCF3973487.1 class 1 fructose-bisphosphatase [Paracoccus salsus]